MNRLQPKILPSPLYYIEARKTGSDLEGDTLVDKFRQDILVKQTRACELNKKVSPTLRNNCTYIHISMHLLYFRPV